MRQVPTSSQFKHIVFPREEVRRGAIDFAPPDPALNLTNPPEQDLPEDESRFLSWLFQQAGIDVRQYRSETLHRRMSACLRMLRATSPAHAKLLIEQQPKLAKTALSTMLVGVTSFFRDPLVFEQLRTEIVPELAGQREGICVWSIGCSKGAELYSIAIILAEAGLLQKSYLLGTDCRQEAVERAREGRYETSELTQVSSERLSQFFEMDESGGRISSKIRKAVRWRVGNLLDEVEVGLWDLILIRNTAMYLRADTSSALWPRLEAAVRPGGVLVLGRAERPNSAHRLRLLGPCLYRRHRS